MDNVAIMDKGQNELPSLPVPPLDQTLARYLESIRPLTTDEEYDRTVQAVKQFKESSLGPALDQRLRERVLECEQKGTSWLAEWWDEWAYFTHRDSSTFFVNYYFGFQDDPRIPTQTARAALLVSLALEFRQLIATRTLTPDMARNSPFCMNMYRFLFNYSRITGSPADTAVGHPTEANNHICVVRNGRFYIFETLHLPSKPSSVLSPREIMIQLERIKKMADDYDDKSSVPPIGILSTGQRDQVANDRMTLFEAHVSNKAHMAKIETSMFVLCLDSSSPSTSEEFSRACWHGDGASRWFDKCFQLVVFENGRAGMNGEHSKMDATPTSRLCRYLIDEAQARALPDFRGLNAEDLYECASVLDKPQPLNFVSSPALDKTIVNAFEYFRVTVDAHEMIPTEFKNYAMDDPEENIKVKAAACRAAVARHAQYTAWAVDGQAVDRHLLGLRLIRKPEEDVPTLFADPVFARTCRWRLSTSQISDDCFIAYGWGEVVPDGYGCAYMVKETELYFCITSLKLGSKEFGQHIADALEDMRFMFEEVRKIEKAEATQAAKVAAAAKALSQAERTSELAMASHMNPASPVTIAERFRDSRVALPDDVILSRSPSPARSMLPAPRTSLFFQKHDPVLRTALARNAIAMAQEKYWSGIDEIAFDDLTLGSPRLSNKTLPSSATLSTGTASDKQEESSDAVGRTRSGLGSQGRTFMAILMAEDGILSRLRPSRGSNLNDKKTTPPSSP
ncbi:Carnitine O-acetyltransferase mitochondrial [Modicella reniformis]|uniref:Carnitine O-acetyltransferase mitochondrial n=1 Tax=Modicella reniformis TaxID=1440133 RepID=A0A9P6M069_9FUNG|nr:Carnitine O-acetyltransferase mitochondrial [Modicella reniformis]